MRLVVSALEHLTMIFIPGAGKEIVLKLSRQLTAYFGSENQRRESIVKDRRFELKVTDSISSCASKQWMPSPNGICDSSICWSHPDSPSITKSSKSDSSRNPRPSS